MKQNQKDKGTQKHKNQERLIEQNRKLNEEIRKLENQMSKVITDNVVETYENIHNKGQKNKKLQELSTQENYIKKLKAKLIQMKASKSYERPQEIRKEEDLIFPLKKQYEALLKEKQTLARLFNTKKQALDFNKPLDSLKSKTEQRLMKLKQENSSLFSQIIDLERDVRKYHKYQNMNKSYKDQKIIVGKPQFQVAKLEHQKKSWERRVKATEDKWKPQFENLDQEFMSMKEIMNRKQRILNQYERQLRQWQTRASAARTQFDVIQDRQRISKVVTNTSLKSKSKEKLAIFRKQNKSQGKLNEKNQAKRATMKSMRLSQTDKKENKTEEKRTERKWNVENQPENEQNKLDSKVEDKEVKDENVSSQIEEKKSKIEEKKGNKILTHSVGVGTSFYYNEDED